VFGGDTQVCDDNDDYQRGRTAQHLGRVDDAAWLLVTSAGRIQSADADSTVCCYCLLQLLLLLTLLRDDARSRWGTTWYIQLICECDVLVVVVLLFARIVTRMSACRSACHGNNFRKSRACRTCRRGSSRGCRCRCRRRGMRA